NVQTSLDGSGDENILPEVVKAITEAHDVGISIDTRNLAALKEAIKHCKKPPLINYLSLEEKDIAKDILALCRDTGASLIIRALKGIIPVSFEGKLQCLEELIEMANAEDIPNEKLFADPSVVHIGRGAGQDHLISTRDTIEALKTLVEPPINTIGWVGNVATGLPKTHRGYVTASFLLYLAGAGLDAAIVDVYDAEIAKAIYMVKTFRGDVVFTPQDLDRWT
ncbi:MAG: hypothetical protein D6778_06110, partial [Nitrospirae bacterium]